MRALEEAYLVVFGTHPINITRRDLAEFAIEGLSVKMHGRTLVARCKEEIAYDPNIPAETKVWAKEEFGRALAI